MSLEHGHFEGRPSNNKEDIASLIQEKSSHRHVANPPFDLLASLYLDGRQRPERKVVVYLDPKHHDFPQPDGKVRMRARLAQGENGALVEHAWVFKDVGIETRFDKMLISENRNQTDRANQPDEDTMIAAMNLTELSGESNLKNDEKCNIGQIVIVVERIILGIKWSDENYRPRHCDGQMDDVNMNELGNDITHTAKYIKRKSTSFI